MRRSRRPRISRVSLSSSRRTVKKRVTPTWPSRVARPDRTAQGGGLAVRFSRRGYRCLRGRAQPWRLGRIDRLLQRRIECRQHGDARRGTRALCAWTGGTGAVPKSRREPRNLSLRAVVLERLQNANLPGLKEPSKRALPRLPRRPASNRRKDDEGNP